MSEYVGVEEALIKINPRDCIDTLEAAMGLPRGIDKVQIVPLD